MEHIDIESTLDYWSGLSADQVFPRINLLLSQSYVTSIPLTNGHSLRYDFSNVNILLRDNINADVTS